MDSRLPRSNHPPRLRVREAVAKPQAAVSLFGLSSPQQINQVADYLGRAARAPGWAAAARGCALLRSRVRASRAPARCPRSPKASAIESPSHRQSGGKRPAAADPATGLGNLGRCKRNCSALPVSAFVASARVCDLLLGVKHVFVVATCLPLLGERSARHNESRAGLPAKFTDVIDNQERRETCEHGANSCSGSARPRAALPSLSYLVSARVRDLLLRAKHLFVAASS